MDTAEARREAESEFDRKVNRICNVIFLALAAIVIAGTSIRLLYAIIISIIEFWR